MSQFEFFVRLDHIEFTESFVVPKIAFRGWCTIPDLSYIDKIQIKPLVFNLSEQRSDFHKGTTASNIISLSQALKIKFFPTNRSVNSYDSNLAGLQLIFEGEFAINVEAGKYGVIIDASLEQHRALSNQWDFNLRSEASRFQAEGAFLTPKVSWMKSSFFILSGWAYRENDSVKEVELRINQQIIKDIVVGLDSKHLKETVLNVRGANNNVFAKIISIEELGEDKTARWLEITANIVFNSGTNLTLNFPAFRIEPRSKNYSYLNTAAVGLDGVARVSGFSLFGEAAIRTRKSFLNLLSMDLGINEHHPESVLGRSFEAGANLERLPGFAQIYLNTLQGWKLAKPNFIQRHFRKTLSKFNYRFSYIKGISNFLLSYLPSSSIPENKNIKPKAKRIFIASHNLSAVEGAPKVLLEIFSALKHDITDYEILLVSPEDGKLAKEWQALGVKVELQADIKLAQRLLYDFSPSMVFANTVSSYWAVSTASELEIPSIWSVHESVNPYQTMLNLPSNSWMSFAKALRDASKICFVSAATEQLYKPYLRKAITTVIPNAVRPEVVQTQTRAQLRTKLGLSSDDFMVLCVGTTAHRKGQDIVLHEMKLFKEKIDKNLKIFFVGARESDYLDSLRILASQQVFEVIFIPETNEIEDFYLAADLKVIASREESAPLVSLEAMKYGVPIVSTNVFGLAEQMKDRESCLFFDYNKQGDLSEKALKIFNDPLLKSILIEGGQKTVKDKFSKDQQIKSYKELILNLV